MVRAVELTHEELDALLEALQHQRKAESEYVRRATKRGAQAALIAFAARRAERANALGSELVRRFYNR